MIVTYGKRTMRIVQQKRSTAKIQVQVVNLVLNRVAEWCQRVFPVAARCSIAVLPHSCVAGSNSRMLNSKIKGISNLMISCGSAALTQFGQFGELLVGVALGLPGTAELVFFQCLNNTKQSIHV